MGIRSPTSQGCWHTELWYWTWCSYKIQLAFPKRSFSFPILQGCWSSTSSRMPSGTCNDPPASLPHWYTSMSSQFSHLDHEVPRGWAQSWCSPHTFQVGRGILVLPRDCQDDFWYQTGVEIYWTTCLLCDFGFNLSGLWLSHLRNEVTNRVVTSGLQVLEALGKIDGPPSACNEHNRL